MIDNNQKYDKNNNVNNTLYKENRNSIIQLIKKINKALDNSSQTFFLALYYLDLILTNENFEKIFKYYYENNESDLKIEINKNDLIMISLSCLIVASKFNENDPNVPNIISFINLCAYYSYNKYIYKVEELIKAEVIVIKLLEYKLNYYTLYHFFSFFFTHGFLLEKIFEKEAIKMMKLSKNEILEKIYILSREIMDEFIEDYENIKFILGNDVLFTSIEILISATQHILNNSLLELFDEKKNIFELLYQINCEQNKENNEIIKNKLNLIYDIKKTQKEKETVKEIKVINKIKQSNKENKIMNESNSKINDEDINSQNNNLLISCDTFLEKYKYSNTSQNKISNNEIANSNKKSNEKFSNIQFYITKYKFFGKNTKGAKGVSRSINNFKYKKLFQFNNNIHFKENNRYNYSSSKKENKENIVFNDNIRTSLDKYLKTNESNNTNNLNDKFNNIYLNYRYDNINVNNNDFNGTNDIKPSNKISCIKNNIHQNYNEYKINENNRDMVYKTKLILDKFSYPSVNIIKNMKNSEYFNNNNNQQSNFYHSKLFDNIINNKMNDRYSTKENIQDNFSESININRFNSRSIDFIKDKNFLNDYNLSKYKINYHKNKDIKLCKNEDNKMNNYFSGTFYQYGKLNQYENIDKFCTSFTNIKYIPYYSKNRNKYYY